MAPSLAVIDDINGTDWIYANITSHVKAGPRYTPVEGLAAWATFFVVSVCSKFAGPYMPRTGLPMLTAYIIVGVICGPFSLDIVHAKTMPALSYINQFALAYITMSAGAELLIEELRPIIWKLLAVVFGMFFMVFGVCTVVVGLLANTSLILFINPFDPPCQWAVALIMACICATTSPATAIAIVRELKCKGNLTTTMLGLVIVDWHVAMDLAVPLTLPASVQVVSDVVVLICIAISFAFGKSACHGNPFNAAAVGIVIAMIIVSLILGSFLGVIFIGLMKSKWLVLRVLILPAGFAVFFGASAFTVAVTNALDHEYELEIEALLVCIVGGFVCVNFSQYHHRFGEVLESSGPYIFIPFFTLVGASLDLKIFVESIEIALILFVLRAVCIFMGTFFFGCLVKQDPKVNKYMWLTLLPQGGFSFGVAATVSVIFPGWGSQLQALIVSCVIVNQLIGPIFCKRAMIWADEAGKASGDEAHHEDAANPFTRMTDDQEDGQIVEVQLNEVEVDSVPTPMEGKREIDSTLSVCGPRVPDNLPTVCPDTGKEQSCSIDHSEPLEPPPLKRENLSV